MVKTFLTKAEPVTYGEGDYRLEVVHRLWFFEWHETYIGTRTNLFGIYEWKNAHTGAPVTAYWKAMDLDTLLIREVGLGRLK